MLDAANTKDLTIFWILISHSPYKDTEFEKYQAAHSPNEPLDTLEKPKRNQAWGEICEKIKTTL